MPVNKSGPEPSNNKFLKIVAALAMLAGAAYLAIGGYHKVQPTAAINNGNTGDGFGQRGPNREEMAREVGITPQQQAAIDKARETAQASGDWRGMREAMTSVLTEDQRTKMRDAMQARMAQRQARMKAMLSEADQKAMEARRGQGRGGRGGPGGGGRGGPGGPGGGPGGPGGGPGGPGGPPRSN